MRGGSSLWVWILEVCAVVEAIDIEDELGILGALAEDFVDLSLCPKVVEPFFAIDFGILSTEESLSLRVRIGSSFLANNNQA